MMVWVVLEENFRNSGVFVISHICPEDGNGNIIPGYGNFSDTTHYPSRDALKQSISQQLKVDPTQVEIEN